VLGNGRHHQAMMRPTAVLPLALCLLVRRAGASASAAVLRHDAYEPGHAPARISTQNLSSLLERLLHQDNMDIRVPMHVQDGRPNLVVQFDLAVNKLVNFDPAAGVVSWSIYYRLMWNDDRLLFNGTEEFGPGWMYEEDALIVPEDELWTPSIVPFNSHEDEFSDTVISIHDSNFLAERGYNVFWSRPAMLNVGCDARLEDFPFDVQECTLVVGPWSSAVSFSFRSRRGEGETGDDKFAGSFQSEEWEVLGSRFRNASAVYTTGPTEEVHFSVTFRRYPHYVVVNAVLPMALVVILSSLTLWLPIEGGSGERLGFSVTLLLTILAMALFTASLRPASREETWLDRYQSWCFFLSFFPVFESVLVVWLQHLFEKVGQDCEDACSAQASESTPEQVARPRYFAHRLAHRLQHESLASTAGHAMRATVRARTIVYLMQRVPTLEWCLTGSTSQLFGPRVLDRWCRLWFLVVLIGASANAFSTVPTAAFTGSSTVLLLAAMLTAWCFYLCVVGSSAFFLLLEILLVCGKKRRAAAAHRIAEHQATSLAHSGSDSGAPGRCHLEEGVVIAPSSRKDMRAEDNGDTDALRNEPLQGDNVALIPGGGSSEAVGAAQEDLRVTAETDEGALVQLFSL